MFKLKQILMTNSCIDYTGEFFFLLIKQEQKNKNKMDRDNATLVAHSIVVVVMEMCKNLLKFRVGKEIKKSV